MNNSIRGELDDYYLPISQMDLGAWDATTMEPYYLFTQFHANRASWFCLPGTDPVLLKLPNFTCHVVWVSSICAHFHFLSFASNLASFRQRMSSNGSVETGRKKTFLISVIAFLSFFAIWAPVWVIGFSVSTDAGCVSGQSRIKNEPNFLIWQATRSVERSGNEAQLSAWATSIPD